MKKIIIIAILISLSSVLSFSQNKRNDMPDIEVKSLDGKMISARSLLTAKPTVVSFWATWCKPCLRELNAIHDVLPDWEDVVDFRMIAISVDDSRSVHKVAPFVKGRAWDFEVYLDPNSDLKRALNVSTVPHTFLFDASGKLVWQHNGYSEGDEEELLEKIKFFATK